MPLASFNTSSSEGELKETSVMKWFKVFIRCVCFFLKQAEVAVVKL